MPTDDFHRWLNAVSTLCEVANLSDTLVRRVAKEVINSINWHGGEGETVAYMIGVDPEDFNPGKRAIKAQLKHWAEERVRDAFEEIDFRFRGADRIPIYRMITAPPDWQPEAGRHPGLYWSWDEHAAEAHWGEFGNGQVKWLLTAEATAAMIDWARTLFSNALPDQENEREITLKKTVPVPFTHRRV